VYFHQKEKKRGDSQQVWVYTTPWHQMKPKNSIVDVQDEDENSVQNATGFPTRETIKLTTQFMIFASEKSTCYLVTNGKIQIFLVTHKRERDPHLDGKGDPHL
jgi:hypothetical protein